MLASIFKIITDRNGDQQQGKTLAEFDLPVSSVTLGSGDGWRVVFAGNVKDDLAALVVVTEQDLEQEAECFTEN